jgi:tripartite-type tricarboxylate transporter receptor subunit TctC
LLRRELDRVIASPQVIETFRKAGGRPLNMNLAQARALVRRDVERWSKLVRELGITPD